MSGDAMERWSREAGISLTPERPDDVPLQPSDPGPEMRRGMARFVRLSLGLPALLGAVIAGLVLAGHGWPPPVSPPSPWFVLVAALPALIATITAERVLDVVAAAASAAISGFVLVVVVLPVWAVLEFFDCWMSWLSDC